MNHLNVRPAALPERGSGLCGCGCGAPAARTFLPGHDQRLKGMLARAMATHRDRAVRVEAAEAMLARGWGYIGDREAWAALTHTYVDPGDRRRRLPCIDLREAAWLLVDEARLVHGHAACCKRTGRSTWMRAADAHDASIWSCGLCTRTTSLFEQAERQRVATAPPVFIEEFTAKFGTTVPLDTRPVSAPESNPKVATLVTSGDLYEAWVASPAEVDTLLGQVG